MHEANAMDFDDLLVRTVNLLELFEDVRDRYQRAFRWVLVDEYQDTNRAQYRLLQLLAEEHGNLTVVGDDSQSIYGFRHADIRNILDFERDFPDAEVIKLEQNYRSTGTILDAANAVIANNREQKPKHLWTDAGRGEPVQRRRARRRARGGPLRRRRDRAALSPRRASRRDEVAVFYRTNAQSRVLEDTLVRFELPYQVIGGTKFYERAEIKDAVAYLSLLANPADAVSFSRIVNSPRRGIGDRRRRGCSRTRTPPARTIWDVLREAERVPALGTGAPSARSAASPTRWSRCASAPSGSSVAELLDAVLRETGYVEALEAERTIEAEGRVENLQELIGVAGEFDANREVEGDSDVRPLEEFLAADLAALRPGLDARRREPDRP